MEETPPDGPSSVVHAPKCSQSWRGTRASKRDSARNSPYPSWALTPAQDVPVPEAPAYTDPHVQGIALMLDTLPPQFALSFLPGLDEIKNLSSGEMVIIPLLCSIAASLASRPPPTAAPNFAPLEASITNLSARMAPPSAPAMSYATVVSLPSPQPPSATPPSTQQPAPPGKKGKRSLKKTAPSSSAAKVASALAESRPRKAHLPSPRPRGGSLLPAQTPSPTPLPNTSSGRSRTSQPTLSAKPTAPSPSPSPPCATEKGRSPSWPTHPSHRQPHTPRTLTSFLPA